MRTAAVIEHHTKNPDNDGVETLLIEHRYWRARLREAIEDSKRERTNAAAFRQYCRNVSSRQCRSTES